MPFTMDLAGGVRNAQVTQDAFCAPHPPHAQHLFSSISPKSSAGTSPFTVAEPEPISTPAQLALTEAMDTKEPIAMQWTGQPDSSTNHASLSEANYHIPGQSGLNVRDFFPYAQNDMSYNDNYRIPYASQYPISNYQQTHHSLNINGLPRDVDMSESYPPAAYQIEPQTHYDTLSDPGMDDHLMQMKDDYEHHYGSHIKHEEYISGYNSPYPGLMRGLTPSNDSPRHPHEMSVNEDALIDKEQPYAQLIYQALLQADGHTMILRDIYDWFLKYTDKAAASETKGWQNSIRHNLSMNGVHFDLLFVPSSFD